MPDEIFQKEEPYDPIRKDDLYKFDNWDVRTFIQIVIVLEWVIFLLSLIVTIIKAQKSLEK